VEAAGTSAMNPLRGRGQLFTAHRALRGSLNPDFGFHKIQGCPCAKKLT
jgi:hypothetical protein